MKGKASDSASPFLTKEVGVYYKILNLKSLSQQPPRVSYWTFLILNVVKCPPCSNTYLLKFVFFLKGFILTFKFISPGSWVCNGLLAYFSQEGKMENWNEFCISIYFVCLMKECTINNCALNLYNISHWGSFTYIVLTMRERNVKQFIFPSPKL